MTPEETQGPELVVVDAQGGPYGPDPSPTPEREEAPVPGGPVPPAPTVPIVPISDDAPPPPPGPRLAEPVKQQPSPTANAGARRNKPCPCGSGNKYKNCCLPKQQMEAVAAVRAARLPEAARALLADFIQFLMETGQFEMVAYLKPEAWELLALQTLHARYLMFRRQEALQMQQERQNDPAFLQQQRQVLLQQLGQVDRALTAVQRGPAMVPEAGNTSPASLSPEAS